MAPMPQASYTLTLENTTASLESLAPWIQTVAQQLSLTAETTFRIDLILAEVITNIVEYAYSPGQFNPILIKIKQQANQLVIEVQDQGIPFDPLQAPPVTLPTTLQSANIGGLGIHLLRHYSDECFYQRLNDQNQLTIIIHLPTD
jgi:anti-sigma regulatory factor (Ser/Thr protein kinase)